MIQDIKKINFTKLNGLVPVVVQDNHTLQVLMVGFMNEEALHLTLASSKVTFYSRTKQRIWQKGETSGHFYSIILSIDTTNIEVAPIFFNLLIVSQNTCSSHTT